MQNNHSTQAQYLRALKNKIIPWLDAEGLQIVLAEPPLTSVSGVKILEQRPPLPKVSRTEKPLDLRQYIWPEQRMYTIRHVEIGCVLEGEADFALGTNMDIGANAAAELTEPVVQVVTFPAKTLFVLPPGVPRTESSRPHWERPNLERANSRIFWVLFPPAGVVCHICWSRDCVHQGMSPLTIANCYLEPLVRKVVDELRAREDHCNQVVRGLMLALLWQVVRNLDSQPILLGMRQNMPPPLPLPHASPLVQDVCRFIQQHANEPLTLPGVAGQHYISPSQLSRRFRAEIGMGVIDYAIHCRIEAAKYLLTSLDFHDLSIRKVSRMAGFAEVTYFERIFKQRVGVTPTAFRDAYQEHLKGTDS